MSLFATFRRILPAIALAPLLAGSGLFAQEGTVEATAVVTVVPKDGQQAAFLTPKDLKVTSNRKPATVTSWMPLRGDRAGLELIVLIDDSARSRLGQQIPDIKQFIRGLPPQAQVGVAYMRNGQSVIFQNLTGDREAAANALRMPMGSAGSNASPYFCLSDLAKRWPSNNPDNRREVLMVTDGVDNYGGARFDPENPYVLTAISDSQKARLIVDSIYYRDSGDSRDASGGQDYLEMTAKGTGGKAYNQLTITPVSFAPYLNDLHSRLMNQYELGFMTESKGRAQLQEFKVKTTVPKTSLDAPEKVLVGSRR